MIVTDKTFDQEVQNNTLILMDFWAEWCGPCKKLSPILDEISEENNLALGKIDSDTNPEKVEEYSISSMPTLILFKDGIAVKTIIGAQPKHKIIKELSEWL